MSDSLRSSAADLERHLKRKINCWIAVGWTKESNGSAVMNVFYDQRTDVDPKLIPSRWRGMRVVLQPTYPPGVQPPEWDLDDFFM
ncbi:MAG: hypothetical protein AB7L09_00720 [Nitrospira sp.]